MGEAGRLRGIGGHKRMGGDESPGVHGVQLVKAGGGGRKYLYQQCTISQLAGLRTLALPKNRA